MSRSLSRQPVHPLLLATDSGLFGTATTPGADPTPMIESPSELSAPHDASADAIAAYRAMWEDYAVAAETANWQSPRLTDHATGDALDVISRGLYASSYNGEVAKGRPVLDPTVASMKPRLRGGSPAPPPATRHRGGAWRAERSHAPVRWCAREW